MAAADIAATVIDLTLLVLLYGILCEVRETNAMMKHRMSWY